MKIIKVKLSVVLVAIVVALEVLVVLVEQWF